jgi:hypothetical protein
MSEPPCPFCEIDHFIPWARHPDNGIENLVIADQRCNRNKRDFRAAGNHVEQWAKRLSAPDGSVRSQLAEIAQRAGFDRHSEPTINVARTIFSRLSDDVRLWLGSIEFVAVSAERERLVKVLNL